jgi:molybdopterin-biosynthesis enzyme MoeA-like protein
MAIGLIIIGDEIMSGKHVDKHFPRVIEMLKMRGLHLDWAEFIGDEPERIIATLRRTLASGDIVFSCGGIGATPDDHTRQCAAAALGVPLEMHPDAKTKIQQRIAFTAEKAGVAVDPDAPDYLQRLKMGEFPRGAQIIPNPVNQIPGFSIGTHYFVPGFPEMAAPMIEWALDTHHSNLFHQERHDEKSVLVFGTMEATLTPLMESIEADYPLVKVFSLPHMGDAASRGYIELGVKGEPVQVGEAFNRLVVALNAKNVEYRRI